MVNGVGKHNIFLAAAAVFCALLLEFLLFVPFPDRVKGKGVPTVLFDDGTSFSGERSALYKGYLGCTEEEIFFEIGGRRASMKASGAFSEQFRLLSDGVLVDLFGTEFSGTDGIEQYALYRTFGGIGYYADEFFAYDGQKFFPTPRRTFSEVALVGANISAEVLAESGAQTLFVCTDPKVYEAEFSGKSLLGTKVSAFRAAEPYFTDGNALYLRTAGGVRLVAALPLLDSLEVGEVYFCDVNSLLPCRDLVSLVLPFAGTSASLLENGHDGRLACLFGEDVPASLRSVKVKGGVVLPFAFEGCPFLEEIDLCSIPSKNVSPDAFVGCKSLKKLHTLQEDPNIGGEFTVTELPCGCYLYERGGTL